ncbi:hypothetical protein Tco_1185506 [Tanacetum coccineum]
MPLKELQEPWKQQLSKMQSQHSQKSMRSCDTKPIYAVEKDQGSEESDKDIIVDSGWDDFCLTSAKLPRMEAHRLGRKTRTIREELIKVKGRLTELEKQEATPQEFGEAIADLTKRLEKVGISEKTLPKNKQGTSTDDLPTQDDQVRNYQWTQRRRFELQRSFRRLRRQRYNNTLESMVDPEQQLVISGRRRAQLAPAEETKLIYDYVIIKATRHCKEKGTNALVVLQDTRWSNTVRIISTMEVDLTQGTQLVYMVPDIMMSINDFHDHLRVSIQTHGYEAWQDGESNLLVTLSMVGRLSNTSYVGFNYNIDNVVDHLSTRGISAIPGERRTMEELEGQSWHLRPVENETAKVPTGVAVHQRINRTTSLRFERYRNQTPSRASVDQRDQEVMGDEEEILTAAVALMESKVPHQNNERCACEECLHNRRHITYDVCFCRSCLIEEEDLKYEPLNVQKRSNKPRSKNKQKWSTLGEPSGKWDYYVRYDMIQPTSPIEEVAATGWGDEFEDNENQTSTTKIIVLEQDNETASSESEWENPCATKRGESQESCFHLNEDEELPYLKFKREVERILANEVHIQLNPQLIQKGFKGDYGNYHNQQWSLPPAYAGMGALLVLPEDPGL